MTTIGPMDPVYPSDTLTITMSYGVIFPFEYFIEESALIAAVQSLGHNVLMVDVDSIIGFRKIIVRVHPVAQGEAGVIGKQIADTIRDSMWSLYSVTPEKYELGSGDAIVSTQTAVSFASIAIIALVGVGTFFYLTGGRK